MYSLKVKKDRKKLETYIKVDDMVQTNKFNKNFMFAMIKST